MFLEALPAHSSFKLPDTTMHINPKSQISSLFPVHNHLVGFKRGKNVHRVPHLDEDFSLGDKHLSRQNTANPFNPFPVGE